MRGSVQATKGKVSLSHLHDSEKNLALAVFGAALAHTGSWKAERSHWHFHFLGGLRGSELAAEAMRGIS